MYDLVIACIAVVTAMTCMQQLVRLDQLAHEFRQVAEKAKTEATDLFQAMVEDVELSTHQRILRTEALAASSLLMLSFSCLLGVVLISW
ncbi:MAG: hypothetical protein AAF543_23285 [Pseudomonadota bacterium]